MLCRNPYGAQGGYFPCGQCLPCRINRKRLWTHRLLLETLAHGDNSFVTLTYEKEPEGGNLVPKHTQDWLKRLRKTIEPLRMRYYLVGEYGTTTQRPHYHAALFGYPSCSYGQSRYRLQRNCCHWCDTVRDTWNHGNILLGRLEPASAQYIVGYVMKKMTNPQDERLNGRHPEFARMSLRPGIGAPSVPAIAETLERFNLDKSMADVPSALQHGKKLLPLGRYLRRRLREAIGRDPATPQSTMDEIRQDVLVMQQASISSKEFKTTRQLLMEKDQNRAQSMIAKANIHKKRDTQ